MHVALRSLRPLLQQRNSHLQARSRQISFCATTARGSGHSKWSSIKHDKAKNDSARNKQRSIISHEIQQVSRMGGPDPNLNPRLATVIANAKKASMPKALIDAAIARGQGRTASGAALEPLVIEAMLPQSVAVVIDCHTDNKLRTLPHVRNVIKKHEGNAAPVSYLFRRKGRVVFEQQDGVGVDEVLEAALEAGAMDVVEDDSGRIVLYTEPSGLAGVGEKASKYTGLQIEESELLWDPEQETMVRVDDEAALQKLCSFVEAVKEDAGVQDVYMNVAKGDVSPAQWEDLQSRITV